MPGDPMGPRSEQPSQLSLRSMRHPADPGLPVSIFGNWQSACEHLQSHLLTEPECRSWVLVIPELEEMIDLQDPDARRAYHQRAVQTRGIAAQGLYDVLCRSIQDASREASRLKWFVSEGAVTVALGTTGILMVVMTELKTAFLPGQGDPESVRKQQEQGGPRPDDTATRGPGMRPGRRGSRDEPGRQQRSQQARSEDWTDSQRLFYAVFRPAVQFIRARYRYELDARGQARRGDYGLLKDVLPPMSQLKYDHWLILRREAQSLEV
jgi:hypothetical protein